MLLKLLFCNIVLMDEILLIVFVVFSRFCIHFGEVPVLGGFGLHFISKILIMN